MNTTHTIKKKVLALLFEATFSSKHELASATDVGPLQIEIESTIYIYVQIPAATNKIMEEAAAELTREFRAPFARSMAIDLECDARCSQVRLPPQRKSRLPSVFVANRWRWWWWPRRPLATLPSRWWRCSARAPCWHSGRTSGVCELCRSRWPSSAGFWESGCDVE